MNWWVDNGTTLMLHGSYQEASSYITFISLTLSLLYTDKAIDECIDISSVDS